MKRVGLITAAILTLLLSFLLMHSQRLQETVQLWNHYNIVYISSDFQEEAVCDLLINNGAEGVISKESSLYSVKNHMLPTLAPYKNDGFTSESMRSFFFKDKSGACFLLYVPETSLETVINTLNQAKIPFGIDATAQYPALCPILCFAAFIILMLINRIDFTKALCLLPIVSVSYAIPFYSVAASICCFIFVFIIIDLYEGRSGALQVLLKKAALFIILAAGITAAILSGTKAFLLVLAGLILTGLLVYLRILIIKELKNNQHFAPVLIITAPWIDGNRRYNLKSLGTMAVFSLCFMILSQFSGILDVGSDSQDLLLPAPSGYTVSEGFTSSAYDELVEMHTSERKPDLTDFLNEKWYAETTAYRKVNAEYKTAEAGDVILLPSFEEKDGHIVEKDKVLYSFDDAWISSKAEEYSNSEGIEKLLVSENGFTETGYASTGKIERSAFIFPATALCVVCFLGLAALYFVKRRKQ